MPTYEYLCETCDERFEVILSMLVLAWSAASLTSTMNKLIDSRQHGSK